MTILLLDMGAAYGTAKAGVGIMASGVSSPDLVWRNLIPIIMAGVNGIYGLITAVILISSIISPSGDGSHKYSLFTAYAHLASGLCCGLTGLGSGIAIGVAGDSSIRGCEAYEMESKKMMQSMNIGFGFGAHATRKKNTKKSGQGDQLFVAMVLIQVFAGNLGLYGLITSIILSQSIYICE
jgi:V-type H+-transporting ATPase 16kDa proteolipid subunit